MKNFFQKIYIEFNKNKELFFFNKFFFSKEAKHDLYLQGIIFSQKLTRISKNSIYLLIYFFKKGKKLITKLIEFSFYYFLMKTILNTGKHFFVKNFDFKFIF